MKNMSDLIAFADTRLTLDLAPLTLDERAALQQLGPNDPVQCRAAVQSLLRKALTAAVPCLGEPEALALWHVTATEAGGEEDAEAAGARCASAAPLRPAAGGGAAGVPDPGLDRRATDQAAVPRPVRTQRRGDRPSCPAPGAPALRAEAAAVAAAAAT